MQHRGARDAHWIWLALATLALAWDALALDLPLARLAGSAAGFPGRADPFLYLVLHEGGRHAGWLLALALCLAVWWPVGPLLRIPFGQRLRLALGTLLAPLAVVLLKTASQTSCPWDLAEFGGAATYLSHWSPGSDGGSGRCFPAGHATAGFAFVGGYFAFRGTDFRLARTWLALALAAGCVLGLAQQWRGAHFMSHTLWSAVVCWSVAWAVHGALPTRRPAGRSA